MHTQTLFLYLIPSLSPSQPYIYVKLSPALSLHVPTTPDLMLHLGPTIRYINDDHQPSSRSHKIITYLGSTNRDEDESIYLTASTNQVRSLIFVYLFVIWLCLL